MHGGLERSTPPPGLPDDRWDDHMLHCSLPWHAHIFVRVITKTQLLDPWMGEVPETLKLAMHPDSTITELRARIASVHVEKPAPSRQRLRHDDQDIQNDATTIQDLVNAPRKSKYDVGTFILTIIDEDEAQPIESSYSITTIALMVLAPIALAWLIRRALQRRA